MKRNTLLWLSLLAVLTFSACKQGIVEPVQPLTVDDIQNYFWTSNTASPQTFGDDNGKTLNTLKFSPGNHGFSVLDAWSNGYGQLAFDVNSSSIMGTGFRMGSILDLDAKSFFAGDQTSRPKIHTAVIAKGSGVSGCFIATDKGVWLWGAPAGGTSPTLTFDGPGLVFDFLAADGFYIYGATFDGQVWARDLSSTSSNAWKTLPSQLLKGPLNAFTVFQQTVYAAPKSGGLFIYYRSLQSAPWPQLLPSVIKASDQVTALFPYNDNRILIGTSSGSGSNFVSLSYDPAKQYLTYQKNIRISSPITSYVGLSNSNGLGIGTENGLYWGLNDTDGWKLINANVSAHSVAERIDASKHSFIAVISTGSAKLSAYDLNGNLVSLFASQPPQPITEFVVNGGSAVVNQDSICAYDNSKQKWFANMIPFPSSLSDGPLTILKGSFTKKNDSWSAGTLVTETDHHSYPFTGRIIDHLNKLTINGGDYPDVLQVRYSDELQDTIPSWTVYYQKGRGPIMVTKSKTVSGHTSVVSKHVNN